MGKYKISAINIAFLYVGTLMGAGFALILKKKQ